MNPVFPGQFRNGEFKLATGERERIAQYCRGQKDGDAEMILRPKRRHSIKYHKFFFTVVVKMIAEHFHTDSFGAYILIMQKFRPIVTDDGDLKFMGISKMDNKEMQDLVREVQEHMLHEYQLIIPDPQHVDYASVDERASRYS